MTGFDDVPTVLPDASGRGGRLLVPFITAVLVLALGLLLVGLTSGSSSSDESATGPAVTSSDRAYW